MGRRTTLTIAAATVAILASGVANAVVYSNLLSSADLPAGALSFADEVVDFSPGIIVDPNSGQFIPLPPYRDGNNALGTPDVTIDNAIACSTNPSTETCKFISLGASGSLTLRFSDNLLTGSGDSNADLWVFVAGPPDMSFVDISSDGVNWFGVGEYNSLGLGVDIDAFGFGPTDRFAYVRFRDKPNAGQTSGPTLGADIDAVAAISTVAVPLPGALLLLLSALSVSLGLRSERRAS